MAVMTAPAIPEWLTRWAHGELELREENAGTLTAPSGRIVLCDALAPMDRARALARAIKPGKYKVVLAAEGEDVALACLKIARGKVASWEPALFEKGPERVSIESECACFIDAQFAGKHAVPADGALRAALREQLGAAVVIDKKSGANLVGFRSNEGSFSSYWGLDARGNPAVLVTDLGVLGESARRSEAEEEEEEDLDLEDDDFDLAALAAVFEEEAPARTERPPAASPLLPRARQILTTWERSGKLELEEDCDREALAEALLERLITLEGHRRLGPHLSEWLMERGEIADVFATDDELEADIRKK
jgi:hypothetical protein